MSLGNFQSLILKKESVTGTTVKPNKSLKVEGYSINSKVNTRAVKQIEGKTFTPSLLVKGTVETTGTIDFFVDRENFPIFMSMLTNSPTPTSNGDSTYTYSFDVEDSYGLPSFTLESSKDFYTERDTGVVGSKLDISVDSEVIKGSLEVIGLKSLTSYKITNITLDVLTLEGDVSVFLTGDLVSKNGALTSSGTVGTINVTDSKITLGTGEGANFAQGDVVSLFKQTPVYTSGVIPFRFFEKTSIKIADSIANLSSATAIPVSEVGVTITNANEGRYLSGSNFAKLIRQGERMMEGKFTVDSEYAYREFTAFQNLEQRAFEMTLTGNTIGSGTRKESIAIKGMIQYKEGPVDVKVSEFIEVPFAFDFISDVEVTCTTTLASI